MKKILFNMLVIAVFTLSMATLSHGQNEVVGVKNNLDQKLENITLEFISPDFPTWEPAYLKYFVPHNASRLRFTVELRAASPPPKVRTRLELRQVCPLRGNPDTNYLREHEFFASKTPLVGVDEDLQSNGKYFLEINVHPPQGGIPHPRPHCFENPDHLGEGPYEALIFVTNGGQDSLEETIMENGRQVPIQRHTLHLNYAYAFATTNADNFKLIKTQEFLKRRAPARQRGRKIAPLLPRP
jgi:hypothetical protein